MFKSSKEFETAMYDILIQVRDNPGDKNILSKNGDTNFDDALEKCLELKYIKGISIQGNASGSFFINIIGSIRISYEGLKFIESFEA